MVSLQSGFSAGSMHWYQFGPSHHPPRRYDRIKLSILLGNTSAPLASRGQFTLADRIHRRLQFVR